MIEFVTSIILPIIFPSKLQNAILSLQVTSNEIDALFLQLKQNVTADVIGFVITKDILLKSNDIQLICFGLIVEINLTKSNL